MVSGNGPLLDDLRLDGRTAIVTGAGRGIGRTIALALAEAGADVVVAARTVSEIESTAEQVRALGRRSMPVPADVSNPDDVDALVDRTLEEFGKVDIMVNNAGLFKELAVVPFPGRDPSAARGDARELFPHDRRGDAVGDRHEHGRRLLRLPCGGAGTCWRRGTARSSNVSSCNASRAYRLEAVYDSSKAAVNKLTRTMALEWAPYNVCVNALAPGEYNTAMSANAWSDPERREVYLQGIPLRREGDMRNLGVLAVYLASPASDYMTGQIVYIDGGVTTS